MKQHINRQRIASVLKASCLVLASLPGLAAQTVILPGTTLENFDALGSGLPANWSVRTGATASSLGIAGSFTVDSATWAATTGNFRNVASALNAGVASGDNTAKQAGYTDRALGVRQTGSFGDPGAAFTFNVSTLGVAVTDIRFSAQILSVQGYSTTWALQYGLGTNPTGFTTIGSFSDPGTFGATTISASSLGTALDNQANVWLRVVALAAASGTGNRDTFAIDNFSITAVAVPEPGTSALLGGAAVLGVSAWRRRSGT